MISQLLRLIRKYNDLTPVRKGSAKQLTIILVVVLSLTACQLTPVETLNTNPNQTPSSLTSSETSQPQTSSGSESSNTSDPETTASSSEGTSASSDPDGSSSNSSTGLTDPETGLPITSSPTSAPTAAATSTNQPTTVRPIVTPYQTTTTSAKTTYYSPTPTPTRRPTSTPTVRPSATPTPASASFPYRNYGTFFRDSYGTNSVITASTDGGIKIDTGNTAKGVALVRVDSIPSTKRCKVVATANGSTYQYDILTRGKYMGIPLQMGNGSYKITVYEQVSGTSYTPKLSHTFNVTLASSLKPYTAASIMTDFSRGSSCVQKANSLCSGISTATGKVDAIYRWIVNNIDYDSALANNISSGQVTTYLPTPDKTYSTRKGICFDYASLMCAMLRSQGIPTRLVIGQTPLGYHAWNEVYFAGTGWVVVASFKWKQISGTGWVLFDTTFAAGGMSPSSIKSTTHTKQKTY